jgi:hypothetical protein
LSNDRRDLDQDPPPVVGIGQTARMAGLLEPVDDGSR